VPEGEDDQILACDAVVDVIPGAREIEAPNVWAATCTAASAHAGLLRKHFERFSQVQSDGIWSGGAVVSPPGGCPFSLS
jgi:hypothetical protein